jgi:MOSC domain-containing protein
MAEPTKEELLAAPAGSVDTDALRFVGLRGDRRRHLDRAVLEARLAALAPPRDAGSVDLLVARGPAGERRLPARARLTVSGGMPGDRWADQDKYGPDYQLATTRSDVARLVANGQPLELHGDNLYLHLDLSSDNLPSGSRLRLGEALVEVTPVAHNGCKKWVQRFGLYPMQLNLDPAYRALHLRGIYLRVLEDGDVRLGDPVVVLSRGRPAA